jgi:hypothetical protein
MSAMKLRAPSSTSKPKLKFGLPGSPVEQRRELRAAIKKHAETLRRLAR